MDPVNLLPFLLLGTTFGARLLGIAYGLGGIRAGMLAARRLQNTLDEAELAVRDHGQVQGSRRRRWCSTTSVSATVRAFP